MDFQFGEKPNSRSGTSKPPTETRRYFAVGSSDREYVRAYAASVIPAQIVTTEGTLYRQDIADDWTSSNYCELTVPYAKNENETGSMKISFDTTGGTVNIKASLSTIGAFGGGAAVGDFGGAIGVNGPDQDVEGTEIVIPAGKLTISYSHPAGVITMAQIKTLMRNTGVVNSDTFMTFAAGEVLFLGATGSDGTDADAEVSYSFACSENLINQVIGGINVVAKDGWDYAWIKFAEAVAAGKPVKEPQSIYVERVYRRTNLGLLLGFG